MLFNPVVISILILVVLSLLRVNVIFSLLIAALTAGVLAGMPLTEATTTLISGMGGQSQTALSYILLGMFAITIAESGITTILVQKLISVLRGRKLILVMVIAGVACLSQNIIPVHIAFIPILIPPLLMLFNQLKLDRRAVATALTFGLKAPYIAIPFGFGLIFQGIIKDEMAANGMDIAIGQVPVALIIPVLGMFLGLLVAVFFTYRKDRTYDQDDSREIITEKQSFEAKHWLTLVAILVVLVVQIQTKSLVLGALSGIMIMFATRIVAFKEGESIVNRGIQMMGMIAFVMLIASGYATILKETGAVEDLVLASSQVLGGNAFLAVLVMLLVGLLITMGIGSSFGTIPILAALYVPLSIEMSFSVMATACILGTAAALGDAGSPASDSTLGPTSGLNADGRHHHIWDTCVPTFLHFNVPLIIFGIIGALVL